MQTQPLTKSNITGANHWQEAADHWKAAATTNPARAEHYKERARTCQGIADTVTDGYRFRSRLRELILQEIPYRRAIAQAHHDIYGL